MILADLSRAELARRLKQGRLFLRTGPFVSCIRSSVPAVIDGFSVLYPSYPLAEDGFADFHVEVNPPRGPRRWFGAQVLFHHDGATPFKPLPYSQALPFFEWGLNWCIATTAHQFLIIHAAAIERDGFTAILPGLPGAGKSTLCAALIHRGWRLLSDELTLISRRDGAIHPLVRPVSLKNESIAIVKGFAPGAVFSRAAHDTAKGTVALMRAPQASIEQMTDGKARPGWVILPRFEPGAATTLEPMPKAAACMELATQSMNYAILERQGFELLTAALDGCLCYRFTYGGALEEAARIFAALPLPLPGGPP